MGTRAKLRLFILGFAVLVTGLVMVGFVIPTGDRSSQGTVVGATPVKTTITRRGLTAGISYSGMDYAVAMEGVEQPLHYQKPDLDVGGIQPKYRVGDQLKVTWRRRGWLGKPQITHISR